MCIVLTTTLEFTRTMRLFKLINASLAMLLLANGSGCGALAGSLFTPLDTVEQVDVQQYMGKWYEISKYPVPFEVGCYGVTAEYSLKDDGTVRVFNTCRTMDGGIASTIEGVARVDDATTNAKLSVYFFGPFGAPYWIIDLDEDYQWAVVGDPTRSTLWILSRTPTMDSTTYQQILDRLPAKDYDPEKLELMPQFEE